MSEQNSLQNSVEETRINTEVSNKQGGLGYEYSYLIFH